MHEDARIPREEKNNLLDDEFWSMVEECIKMLQPTTEKIFKLESNRISIHEVYMSFKDIKSSLHFILPDLQILRDGDKTYVLNAIDKRMQSCIQPIHLAAYMLDPKTQGVELDDEEEVECLEFMHRLGQMFDIDVMPDLANYRAKEGFWGKSFVWENLSDINPLVWWKGICRSRPLSKVALRLLTAPSSSAATERSFSILGHIHNAKRNRLTTERAAKISYISYNWNLLKKNAFVLDEEEEEEATISPTSVRSSTNSPNEPSTSREGLHEIEFHNVTTLIDSSESESD